ncbi:hypothetical protein [Nostoc sp.]
MRQLIAQTQIILHKPLYLCRDFRQLPYSLFRIRINAQPVLLR